MVSTVLKQRLALKQCIGEHSVLRILKFIVFAADQHIDAKNLSAHVLPSGNFDVVLVY